jgi:hypothetical protein
MDAAQTTAGASACFAKPGATQRLLCNRLPISPHLQSNRLGGAARDGLNPFTPVRRFDV